MIDITYLNEAKLTFSICTFVTRRLEYGEMVSSAQQAGFTDNCEFLYIDNSTDNLYDAYTGINKFLNMAKGEYIIICHQDVLFNFDTKADLLDRIDEVERFDPNWALLGNAGSSSLGRNHIHITHANQPETKRGGPFPRKVISLDENFLLFKKNANLTVSHDLKGFHLYGTDACLIANILGYTNYVIDFHLTHKSTGNVDESFLKIKRDMIAKYSKYLKGRFIQTMSDRFYLSNNFIGRFINQKHYLELCKSISKRFHK